MNETTRERNDLQSRGTTARSDRPNVELETTTTTIEQNQAGDSGTRSGAAGGVADKARAGAQQARERAERAGDQARRTASEAGEEVRRRTRETAALVREQAAEQAAMVKEQAIAQANGRKNDFATKICDVGGALKRAAEDLEQHEDTQLASQTRRLADRIEGVGNHLRESEITELLEDVEHFVRRNPTLALGGMFVAGLSIARFLKAKPPRYERQSPGASGGQSLQYGSTRPIGAQPTGGVNPYAGQQVGSTPRPSQANDRMGGSSHSVAGTSGTAGAASASSMGTPGMDSQRSAGSQHSATSGASPSMTGGASARATSPASAAPASTSPGSTSPASTAPASTAPGSTAAGSTSAAGGTSSTSKPEATGSTDRGSAGSAPRPR